MYSAEKGGRRRTKLDATETKLDETGRPEESPGGRVTKPT